MRPGIVVAVASLAFLVASCGSEDGGGSGQAPADSVPVSGTPEVQTATAAQATQEVAQGVLATTNRDACRANMRSLATAQAMYFGQFGGYGSLSSMVSTGTMDNALDLVCPEGTSPYSLAFPGGGCQIYCQADPQHGSIVDGISSWQ